jgi:hypothetical protein
VAKESSRFGLPGDRENIVKLNADHSGICRFDESEFDQDNFKLVRSNVKDLYKSALRVGELRTTIPSSDRDPQIEHTEDERGLQARFAQLRGN